MTGIERLREWADGYAELSKDHTTIDVVTSGMATLLSSIADQIERETKPKRHTAEYASVSAYDLLPEEDRDAIAWVREHGGLDAVRRRWECLSYYADPVPRSCMEKRLARLQRQIDESHAALRRRNERIAELEERVRVRERANDELNEELNAMRPRLMPEGYEWPRYEDRKPVRIGDVVSDVEVRSVVFRDDGILLSDCTSVPGWGTWRSYKEPIKRPIADTWERLEKDADRTASLFDAFDSGASADIRDLVRRARALAGVPS